MNAAGLQVAETILAQLGGRVFVAMTGAFDITGGENTLMLKFKGSKRWNALKIELTPEDVYTMTFYHLKRREGVLAVEKEESLDDVYSDQLQDVFTDWTGLYTRP